MRRGNLRGQLRVCALSLQRTTLRTSRHPAHTERIRTRRRRYFQHSAAQKSKPKPCSVFQRTVSMRAGSPARGFADSGLNCNVRRNRVPGVSKSIFDAHGARGEMCTADSHYERNDVAPPNSLVVHQSKSMTTRRGLRRACSRYDHELFGRAPCTAWPISGVSASQYAAP